MAATMSEQLEQLSKAPLKHKVLGLALITAVFGALFYFVFYSDLSDKLKNMENRVTLLKQEVADYEEKKQNYMRVRADVNNLLEQQKELLKVLPTEAEIPSFLQALHAQAELAGLNILTFQPGGEVSQKFYAKIPVQMSISGTYHQISKFFCEVGRLKRIVNIQDVQLASPKVTDEGVVLRAKFIASTFRFVSPKKKKSGQKRRRG
jgi:type IV pilus assembly protein PilO